MEIEYRKCLPQHFNYIEVQETQRLELAAFVNSDYAEIACSHIALSAWLGNKCLGAAGFVPITPFRSVAWALLSKHIGNALVPVTKKIRRVISADPTPRIEMHVAEDFEEGQKWALLLGMKLETPNPLQFHGPNGGAEYMYARIRA